jgi:outer membrane protein assembly factor BamE (lipoprotein component of BamABCDE complex)
MKTINIILISSVIFLLGGCATHPLSSPSQNPYTQGNVTLNLKKGVTTQHQVAEAFGAPNIVTQDSDGNQVWIYQKDNVTVESGATRDYFTILLAGVSSRSSEYQQSSQTMTLIIHFNENGKVKDFKSMSTSF